MLRRTTRNKRAGSARGQDRATFSLMVHGPEYGAGEEVVINPECFPQIKVHDLVEIAQPERDHQRLVLQVTSLTPVRGKLQVSVLKDIAAQFGLEPFVPVTVQRVEPRDVTVDFIELTFKDQFLSRADIWRFKVAMLDKCVYVGKHVACLGVRSQVEGLLANNQDHACGVIGAETKMIVRSRSSRLFWLVQMSAEMWEFAPDGELYYEKLLDRLLRVMISKWHESSVSHSVTIIAFSRSFYDKQQFPDDYDPLVPPFSEPTRQSCGAAKRSRCFSSASTATGRGPTIQVDPLTGRYYEDFYKVLVMNYTGPDWDHLLGVLKREFTNYHETHRWRSPEESIPAEYVMHEAASQGPTLGPTESSDTAPLVFGGTAHGHGDATTTAPPFLNTERLVHWTALPFGIPSRAMDGNILEAINVTLNILDKHYMDRDLHRTGQSIVMITAGCSIFHVDERLAQITKQRMMDNGVGMDMISLTTPPMHVVPLFIYQKTASHAVTSSVQTVPSPSREQQQHALDESVRRQRNYSVSSETLDACSLEGLEKELSELEPSSWSGNNNTNTGDGDDSDSNLAQSETPSRDGDSDAAACASQHPPQTVYSIPHWVNITFLDFDCRCRNGAASSTASSSARGSKHASVMPTYASTHSDSASATRSQFNNRLLSHRTQTCECQCYLNQRFLPLPPYRMFDISAPTERLAFPAALKRLIQGYPRKIQRGAALSPSSAPSNADEGSAETETDVAMTPRRRRLSDMSDALSLGSSTSIDATAATAWQNDHLMICRSPDYDSVLTRSPRLVPFTSAYGASAMSHDAFQDYDDEVFSTRAILSGKQTSSLESDDSSAAGLLAPRRSAHDLTSATFSGDTTTLDAAMAAAAVAVGGSKSSKWHATSAHGRVSGSTTATARRGFGAKGSSSTSMIGSLLSPRNDMRVFHQQSLQGHTTPAANNSSGSLKPTLAPKRVATVNGLSTATAATPGIRIPTTTAHGSGRSMSGFRKHELLDTAKTDAFNDHAGSPDNRHSEDDDTAAALDGKLLSKSVDVASSRKFLLAAHKDASATESSASVQRQRACTSNVEAATTPPLVTPPTGRTGSFQHLSQSMTMTKPSPSYYNDLLLRSPPPGPPALTSSLSATAHYDSHLGRTGYYPPSAVRRGHSDVLASSMLATLTPQASSPLLDRPQSCVSTNPFRYSTETLESASQRLTSNRRRWSHLFPVLTTNQQASIGASDVHQHGGVKPIHLGPNWKSLTSPAILPLTTDYYPSAKDLHTSYTESFYTLTLPSMQSETVPKYNDHDELLIEMVCQRLASDFQLVATDASTDSDASTLLHHHHHHHAPTGAPGTASRSNTVVYYLSMGHRIHQMIYDPELQTIDVKRYFQRAIERQKTDAKTYRYSLYVDRTASFHPLQQTFYEYAQPEENWNSLDHLLCGYHDEMSDTTKCRRIRFAIVPPKDAATSATARAAYVAKVRKLIDYFQTRIAPAEDGVIEKIVVRAVARPDTAALAQPETPLPPPSPQTLRLKICCKSSSSSSARSKSDDTRAEWIMLHLEDTLDAARTYHLDMRWLACSGIVADEFVSALKRKSKQSGLELRRVPEYSRVSFLQIHPLIAPIFLPLPPWPHRDNVRSPSASHESPGTSSRASEQERLLIVTLVNRLDFVFDDERLADANGIGYGLGIEREERKTLSRLGAGYKHHRRSASTATRLLAEKWHTRGYKQYMHRSAPVFLRLVHRGLVWIPSYDYDEKSDVARVDELFREICRVLQASAALHDMVESCCCTEAA